MIEQKKIFLISLVLKWPWRNTVDRRLIPPFFSQLIVVTNKAGNDPAQGSTAWQDRFEMVEFTKDLEMHHVVRVFPYMYHLDVYGGMYCLAFC